MSCKGRDKVRYTTIPHISIVTDGKSPISLFSLCGLQKYEAS